MSEISDYIKKIVNGNEVNDKFIVGKVTSINGVLIDVLPEDGTAELKDIRLCAENSASVFIVIPKLNSKVYVSMDGSTGGIAVGFHEVEEVLLRGNQFGGLVKVSSLVNKLNVIESDLNTLKTAFNTWVVVPSDGGLALKTASSSWASQLITQTQVSDLENNKVKHG